MKRAAFREEHINLVIRVDFRLALNELRVLHCDKTLPRLNSQCRSQELVHAEHLVPGCTQRAMAIDKPLLVSEKVFAGDLREIVLLTLLVELH
jgi:hypothetical protein